MTNPSGSQSASVPAAATTPTATASSENPFSILLGILVWVVVFGFIFRAKVIPFVKEWRWAVAAAIAILVIAFAITPIRDRLARATLAGRTSLIVFALLLPLIFAGGAVIMLPLPYRILAARGLFLVIVCLLPATLYYLFIVNRRYSLLNEFLGNLARLGLLRPRGSRAALGSTHPEPESVAGCRRRVLTYLAKFERIYGPIGRPLIDKVQTDDDLSDLTLDPRMPIDVAGEQRVFATAETSLPLLIATILIILGWILTLPPWPDAASKPSVNAVIPPEWWPTVLDPIATPTRFAFLGAYFFSIQLLFRRFIQRDLPAKAYTSVSLRIVLAVIGAWVLLQVVRSTPDSVQLNQETILVLSFVVGAFPPVLWQFAMSLVRKASFAAIVVPSLEAKMPVTELDGITVWHQARLEETSIDDVSDVATADIVDLLVSTRFPPDRVVEWVDQALLYMHVRDSDGNGSAPGSRSLLANHGIRNATSLVACYRASESRNDESKFAKILPGEGRDRIISLIDAVGTNPNFDLVWQWKGLG